MIISFKHNFIYWRAMKVAGSSVVQALGEHCGENDIVNTPRLEDVIKEGRSVNQRNFEHFFPHMPIDEAKRIANIDWDSFFKITTVRNPWDMTVSMYWTEISNGLTFQEWLEQESRSVHQWVNKLSEFELSFAYTEDYYFKDGKRIADHYLRYENLESDTARILKKFGLEMGNMKYPTAKANFRENPAHYTEYYDSETRQIIEEGYAGDIKKFGYEFNG